jgi:hypothetical protein
VKSRFILASIAAAAIAFLGTGCGGGEPDALPKAAFVKQANQICLSATKERESAVTELAKENPQAGPEELVDEAALPPTKDMVDELDGLGVPKGDEKQVEAIIKGLEEGIEKVEANPKEALGSEPFEAANKAAIAYGLTECAI